MASNRTRIDRTTNHMCPSAAADAVYFVDMGEPLRRCVDCEGPIPVHFVQFSFLCATCRLGCTDETDVAEATCVYCGKLLESADESAAMTPDQLATKVTRTVVSFVRQRGQGFYNTQTGEHMFTGRLRLDCDHEYVWHPWAAASMPVPGEPMMCARCIDDVLTA